MAAAGDHLSRSCSRFVVYVDLGGLPEQNYYVGPRCTGDLLAPSTRRAWPPRACRGASHRRPLELVDDLAGPLDPLLPRGFRLPATTTAAATTGPSGGRRRRAAVADAHADVHGRDALPAHLPERPPLLLLPRWSVNVAAHLRRDRRLPEPGEGIGVCVGTLVLVVERAVLWGYTLGCHSCRHLCGGRRQVLLNAHVRHCSGRRSRR